MRSTGVWVALGLLLASARADASLTPSEQVIIRELTTTAKVPDAQKVRALVARPDLTEEESEAAMETALEPVAFTDARMVFLREIVFGGASAASRNVLVSSVVKGLIARADAVATRNDADLDKQAAALAELTKIYGFIDAEIANARAPGSPPRASGHDPQAGISSATYDGAAQMLGAHALRHPKWLKADATLSPDAARLRAQLQLAILDMVSDSPTRRIDAADRAGLLGSRRSFLTELGVLVLDTGAATDARIDRVRAVLLRLPGARADVSAIAFGDEHPALKARGLVVGTKSDLGTATGTSPLFTGEVDPATIDPPVAELAREIARLAVRRALENRPDLHLASERDVRTLGSDATKAIGMPPDAGVESVLTAAVALLVIDAPRVLELAMARLVAGHPEAAAIVSDALGVLATYGTTGDGLSVGLGRSRPDGSTETLAATQMRLATDGTVASFSLSGVRWELVRGDTGAVTGGRRNGEAVTLGMLPMARVPVTDGTSWSNAGLVLAKLAGTPRAGIAGATRFRVAATTDLDAVALPSPDDDVLFDATANVDGDALVLLRSILGRSGIRGVGFEISGGRVAVKAIGDGTNIDLAPAVALQAEHVVHLRMVLKGNKFEATVGTTTTRGVLPPAASHGDVVVVVKKSSTIDLTGVAIRKS